MNNIIQQLKDNEKPFGLMSEEMQAKALEIGKSFFLFWDGDKWVASGLCAVFGDEYTYRLRDTYEDEPEIVDKVFASTTDSETDSMNNVIGVTAHCKCGNVFCDDVVHGKSQSQAHEDEPEIVEIRIYNEGNERYFEDEGEPCKMSSAINSKDFIGFKFEDGAIGPTSVHYRSTAGDIYCKLGDGKLNKIIVLHATHVLFSRKKQE